jgi:pyruvate dehydrogenase E1 component alpha subunit
MVRVRRFEEKCAELYGAGKIRGFLHLYIGEEAVAAGVIPLLGAEDAIVSTYREHGHALLRGVPAGAIMAEMFGRVEGCSRGRGGSMHLFDVSRRFYGGNAIVAGGIPIAVGLALADRMQGRKRVTACLFGDGAVAEGEFHESMNLAALWKLPVLFLCENNQYAMGTAIDRYESEQNLALKPGFEPTDALLRDLLGHARKRLGAAVAPKEIAFLPSLPRTRSGKIMRRLLKARELGLPEGDLSTLEGGTTP